MVCTKILFFKHLHRCIENLPKHCWLHRRFMPPLPKLLLKTRPALAALAVVGMASGASAQVRANSSDLPNSPFLDFQRPAPAAPVPRNSPGVAPPAVPAERIAPSALRFVLRGVQLRGSNRLSAEALGSITQPYLRREVAFSDLLDIAAAIGARLRADGWVVRIGLPAQDLTDGEVIYEVAEARFGGAEIELGGETRFSLDRASAYVASALSRGDVVNSRKLDRAILLLDDLPGVTATGSLATGAREGESVLQLRLAVEPSQTGQLSLDNQGSNATGVWRTSINAALNSPTRIGDQLTAAAAHSEGSTLARLGYSVPIGSDGWRLSVNAAALDYRVTASGFAALAATGRFNSWALDLVYPLLRTLRQNLNLQLGVEDKRLFNQASGASVSDYRLGNTNLGLSGSALDDWQGGGIVGGSLVLTTGQLDLSSSPNRAADASGAQTAGEFQKWRYAVSRQQTLTSGATLLVAWSGQMASKNLDSSERFFLGGPAGVRAYPFGEGGGSEGQLVNLELRQALGGGLTVSGFYDWGRVKINRNNNFTGAATLNEYSLSGAGLSLTWASATGTTLQATWARRLGNNPAANSNGNDQDGTRELNRLWLMASYRF
jgi:hemolysin activation/secretion protein